MSVVLYSLMLFGIIKHLLTGYSGDSKSRAIVDVSRNNKLDITWISSRYVYDSACFYWFIIFLNAAYSQQLSVLSADFDNQLKRQQLPIIQLTTSKVAFIIYRNIFDVFIHLLCRQTKKNYISVMFPFLRPLGALRLWKWEVIEFFNSVLNSAIKIRQEGKEVSISNSFSIYSTSSLTTKTISINSVRANGHVVNDIHLM